MNQYDVIIIGAGPGGIFSAYELVQRKPEWKVAVLEAGNPLEKRHCPIDGVKVKSCIHCKTCAIMNAARVRSPTASIISPTPSAARCTSISASSRPWI